MTAQIKLGAIGTFETGVFDESAAEIPAYDSISQRLFVVNANRATLDVLDLSDPTNPNLLFSISPSEEVVPLEESGVIGGINSVAVSNGIVATAVEVVDSENNDIQLPGQVFFYDTDGNFLNSVTVGTLPDMLTFTPDGTKILVANEGEPGGDTDPEGSISIIDLSGGVENLTDDNVSTADFATFNGREEELRAKGVRIFQVKLLLRIWNRNILLLPPMVLLLLSLYKKIILLLLWILKAARWWIFFPLVSKTTVKVSPL